MGSVGTEQDGRKRRAQERRRRRRGQILGAARSAFSRRGYHATTVADILREAGIARGTFYLYFPSKRAIFDELLDQMFSQIRGAVFRIRTGPGEEPALEQMYRNLRLVMEVLESNRELTIILLNGAVGLDAAFDEKLNAFYDRLSGMIEGTLVLGQSMGLIRPCDSRLVSYCVLGGLKEVMARLLTRGLQAELDRDALARQIMDYNLLGLFAHAARNSP